MGKKEVSWISIVILLLLVIPLSNAFLGNSSSYDVVISSLSLAGFENTTQPTESLEFHMDTPPYGVGNSTITNNTVLLGLTGLLGPIAFNITEITPHMARNDSIVNCTGANAFSHEKFEMPRHLYRFTDDSGDFTDWSESSVLNCTSNFGGCKESNLTCHFKVDDSHMNSTEITKSIIVDTTNPVINLISPVNSNQTFFTWIYEYNVTDTHIVSSCELIIDNVSVENTALPVKDTTLNFTHLLYNGTYDWNVNCTDEAGNEWTSPIWNFKTFDEKMWIENTGLPGFENISNDYTYSREVVLKLAFAEQTTYCRFQNDGFDWTEWKLCQPFMPWILTEGDGNKTVNVEMNHSGVFEGYIRNYSDSIILQSNATSLDITPPENFTVYDDAAFTSRNDTLHFRWDMPNDPEAELLNQAISFTYMLKDSNGTNITLWAGTYNLEATLTGLSLAEGHTYKLTVNATNPAGLSTVSESNGTTVDLTAPTVTSVFGIPDNISWSNAYNLSFNWTANDSLSGVAGYSMTLDSVNDTAADELPETDYTDNRTYENKSEGTYYFHIRAYDAAGNYGETFTYGPVRIDHTPPSEPVPLNPIVLASSNTVIFYWQASTDDLSGVREYNITITDNTTGISYNYNITDANYTFTLATGGRQYFISITAIDNAGNEKSSSEISQEVSLAITSAMPDSSAVVAGKPIIKVETNKIAVCTEDFTGDEFLYTNSTYHETRLNQDSNTYSLAITCRDSDGFYAIRTVTYRVELSVPVVSAISIDPVPDIFIGEAVNASILTDGPGQMEKSNFKVFVDNAEISDFTLLDTDNAGRYSVRFVAGQAGTFTLKASVMGIEDSAPFTVENINLNVEYTGAASSTSKTHLVYSDNAQSKFGLASDSKEVEASAQGDRLILNSSADGKTYIFFTKSNFNANAKDNELKSDSFEKSTKAFGYQNDGAYNVKTSVGYNSIVIEGIKELPSGIYSVFVKNLGQNRNNQTVIRVELE